MMRRLALTLALVAPGGAWADYALPQGCTAYATIQKRACIVSHLYTCAGDAPGMQWRVDLGEDGPTFYGRIDAETQWVESHHLEAGRVEELEGGTDPASFSALLATNRDDYDFVTIDDAGYRTRFTGIDLLTGESRVIDGVTLEQTEFSITATDADTGAFLWSSSGNEWIQRDWRTFISGTSTLQTGSEEWQDDRSPMEIARPGEPGFLAESPRHDCGALMSFAVPLPLPNERL
ncbi:hypothetical protein [Wenxinia saemankumensis]|uniref:Uncharacterized protein n=1 Tax=Wenxinia saemankumensis TaxID=1447782 RepID=A0A1M6FRM8_9RHOB|nr:hypothetical protein [Wenxinia saemankumensis]SHJ00336.1 hypothetical protein SAMN05444417_2463 [Wenxinia saemankumensis]